MLSQYIQKRRIRSEKTAETYLGALKVWARSVGAENPDAAVQKIKDEKLDAYEVLQNFVSYLHGQGKAPKTVWTYFGALKWFLIDSDIELSENKIKAKVVLPRKYEVSTDKAPTRDEVKRIMLRSKLDAKTAIAMLASSGMRIGELCSLEVSNVEFGQRDSPSKVGLAASVTKTRKRRMTFISAEASELLRDHLGNRINDPNSHLFPEGHGALYIKIMRSIERSGLKTKTDSGSKRFALHPHCFRKYFFSNMLAAGVDRGITEGFMGHKFAEDSAYLRMSDAELMDEYRRAEDRFTFLSGSNDRLRSRVEELEQQVAILSPLVHSRLPPTGVIVQRLESMRQTKEVTELTAILRNPKDSLEEFHAGEKALELIFSHREQEQPG
jgi:integrase